MEVCGGACFTRMDACGCRVLRIPARAQAIRPWKFQEGLVGLLLATLLRRAPADASSYRSGR